MCNPSKNDSQEADSCKGGSNMLMNEGHTSGVVGNSVPGGGHGRDGNDPRKNPKDHKSGGCSSSEVQKVHEKEDRKRRKDTPDGDQFRSNGGGKQSSGQRDRLCRSSPGTKIFSLGVGLEELCQEFERLSLSSNPITSPQTLENPQVTPEGNSGLHEFSNQRQERQGNNVQRTSLKRLWRSAPQESEDEDYRNVHRESGAGSKRMVTVLGGLFVVLGGLSVVLGGLSVVLGGLSVVMGGLSVVVAELRGIQRNRDDSSASGEPWFEDDDDAQNQDDELQQEVANHGEGGCNSGDQPHSSSN